MKGVFFSPDIQSSKHKDRRKGSLDVRSTTSRGSDGERERRQMMETLGVSCQLMKHSLLSVYINCWLDTHTNTLIRKWLGKTAAYLTCAWTTQLSQFAENQCDFFFSLLLPGSSQRRHSSMARIHSMTIEAPITKVGTFPSLSLSASIIWLALCFDVLDLMTELLDYKNCLDCHEHFSKSYQHWV